MGYFSITVDFVDKVRSIFFGHHNRFTFYRPVGYSLGIQSNRAR
jgi:hypothetical protein